MLEVVLAYERDEVGAGDVVRTVEMHAPALEAVGRDLRDRLRRLADDVRSQDLSPVEEEMLGVRASREAITELKRLVEELAGLSAADEDVQTRP
jgi:hypothetical protein